MNASRTAIALVVVLCASCGSTTKTTGTAGTGGATGQAGSDAGGAGTTEQGGADGGVAGATGRGGADGGAAGATGGGGAGGATQPACTQHGGSCPGDCTSACPGGTTAVTLACPIVPSNAVCGGMHCCLPITSYSCGSDTCMTGQTFCYSFAPGIPGAGPSRGCMTLPAACAKNPTCACLCPPPLSSPTLGCTFNGPFGSGSCNCSEHDGEVSIFCAGA
jgi:hypothetical protein